MCLFLATCMMLLHSITFNHIQSSSNERSQDWAEALVLQSNTILRFECPIPVQVRANTQTCREMLIAKTVPCTKNFSSALGRFPRF